MGLLSGRDPEPVVVQRAGAAAPFLFVCDHAGRETPEALGRLGLPDSAFDRHIAWDIGAGAVTRRLAAAFGACCILQRYSRLVIDCNRAPDRADAAPEVSDGTPIPGNRELTAQALAERAEAIHEPYHAAIARELDARLARETPTVVIFVHSFTPEMGGVARPWHFGVIREEGSRFSKAMLDRLSGLHGLVVGDNQPYAMDGVDYSAPRHAMARGLDYLELEIRQDLIGDEAGEARICDLLAGQLRRAALPRP